MDWHADHGRSTPDLANGQGDPEWELHNLSRDPEERHNLADRADTMRTMQSILDIHTPGGGAPADSRWNDITVAQMLAEGVFFANAKKEYPAAAAILKNRS